MNVRNTVQTTETHISTLTGEGGADGRNAIFRVAGSEVAEGKGDDAVLEHVLESGGRKAIFDDFDKLMEFKIASTGGNGEPLSVRNLVHAGTLIMPVVLRWASLGV